MKGAAAASASSKPEEGAQAVGRKGAVEKGRDGPRVKLTDLRKGREQKEGGGELALQSKVGPGEEKNQVRELNLDLGRSEAGGRSGTSQPEIPDRPGAGSSDFSHILSERLRDSWNGEIVQNAHIILKDGDAGTIRLRLHPDSLGNVKIELNLSENNISGRIVVESDEAKSAFERNMSQLQDAFREGGFDSAKLEVSVGSGGSQAQDGRSDSDPSAGPFWSERHRSLAFEESVPRMTATVSRAERTLDIFA